MHGKHVEMREKQAEEAIGCYDMFVAAAESGDVRKVMACIRAGADVNQPDQGGWTALIAAAAEGQVEVIKALLVNHEIDVNAMNRDHETALMRAVLLGHTEAATALLAVRAPMTAAPP